MGFRERLSKAPVLRQLISTSKSPMAMIWRIVEQSRKENISHLLLQVEPDRLTFFFRGKTPLLLIIERWQPRVCICFLCTLWVFKQVAVFICFLIEFFHEKKNRFISILRSKICFHFIKASLRDYVTISATSNFIIVQTSFRHNYNSFQI